MTLLYATNEDLLSSIKETRSDFKVLFDVFATEKNDLPLMNEKGFEGRFPVVKPLPEAIFNPIELIENYDPLKFLDKLISIGVTMGTYINGTVVTEATYKRNQRLIVRMDVDAYLDRELEFIKASKDFILPEGKPENDEGHVVNNKTLAAMEEVERQIYDEEIKSLKEELEKKRQLYTFFYNELKSLWLMQKESNRINFIEIL